MHQIGPLVDFRLRLDQEVDEPQRIQRIQVHQMFAEPDERAVHLALGECFVGGLLPHGQFEESFIGCETKFNLLVILLQKSSLLLAQVIDEARFRGEVSFAEFAQENLNLLIAYMLAVADLGEGAATRTVNLA